MPEKNTKSDEESVLKIDFEGNCDIYWNLSEKEQQIPDDLFKNQPRKTKGVLSSEGKEKIYKVKRDIFENI